LSAGGIEQGESKHARVLDGGFFSVSRSILQEVSEAAKVVTNEASSQLLTTGNKSPSRHFFWEQI